MFKLPVSLPLEQVLRQIQQDGITFFPVRHHSPACAWHIQQWIEFHQPKAVLIEGPRDMTDLIPSILHPLTQTPFAVYTTYTDKAKRMGVEDSEDGASQAPRRFAGYYPFCDYSPELVALRAGAAVGARVQFIDLTFPEQTIAAQGEDLPQIRSLQAETHFHQSEYIQALARKTGCRDRDDLWDHLFETNVLNRSTSEFINEVATYCYMTRYDTPQAVLEADGTLAREQAMARAIQAARKEITGPILVVTGGFHTVVLPQWVDAVLPQPKPLQLSTEEAQTVLVRYSFEQLDALNGYGAGMPTPEFYQQVWQQLPNGAPLQTVHSFLVNMSRQTRKATQFAPLSTADAIAALDHVQRMAHLRHHALPTREDLLDSIRSCFVKGAMDGEGAILMEMALELLRGDRIGDLPPDAAVPMIVANFRQRAKQQRLKIETSVTQHLTLDLYRKASHRLTSRLLHQLAFLEVPFGHRVSGADFIRGVQLDRMQEVWDYRWSPQTEGTLIERSLFGATLEEAVLYRLGEAIAALEAEGKGRSAPQAVKMLIQACLMGLHQQTERLLDLIGNQIAEDPSFPSLVEALNQLVLLGNSRETLEAQHLSTIPVLAQRAYQRACYVLTGLMNCPTEQVETTLEGFCMLQELLSSQSDLDSNFDAELFHVGLEQLRKLSAVPPPVVGGAAGILYRAGLLDGATVVAQTIGYLQGSEVHPTLGAGFLRGLFRTCRTVAWSLPALLTAIDTQLAQWEDGQFLGILPDLRLAFADLTPSETDQVAEQVAQLYDQKDLGNLWNPQLSEVDLQEGLGLEQRIWDGLTADGLGAWING